MCGGRRGVREPSEAIAKVKGGGTSYIQRNNLINLLRLMSSIGYRRDDGNRGGSERRRNALLGRCKDYFLSRILLDDLFDRVARLVA